MARKQTFQQRLVTFAITATDDELSAALDTLKAFKDAKTPARSGRKQRSDAGKSRTQSTAPVLVNSTAAAAAGE